MFQRTKELIWITMLLCFTTDCVAKITQKTVLTFFEKEEQWDTYSYHCPYTHTPASYLVHERSEEIHHTLLYHINNVWLKTDKHIWTGLFLNDTANARYQWQRTCEDLDPTVFENFDCDSENCVPQPEDIDNAILCVTMDKDSDFQWKMLSCAEKSRAVCAYEDGPCTYESSAQCFGFDESLTWMVVSNATQANCENLCENYLNGTTECWGYSHNNMQSKCKIYITKNPYIFESVQESCSPSWNASIRRCFESVYSTYHPVHVESYIPFPACNGTSHTEVVFSNSSDHHNETTSTDSTTSTTYSTTSLSSSTITSTVSTTISSTTSTMLSTSSTTSISTTTQVTSTSSAATTSQGSTGSTTASPCVCPCTLTRSSSVVANESIAELLEKIEKELSIDKTTLSSYVRKQTCATDNRPVAKSIGLSMGAGILCIIWAIIVIPDLVNVFKYISRQWDKDEKEDDFLY